MSSAAAGALQAEHASVGSVYPAWQFRYSDRGHPVERVGGAQLGRYVGSGGGFGWCSSDWRAAWPKMALAMSDVSFLRRSR